MSLTLAGLILLAAGLADLGIAVLLGLRAGAKAGDRGVAAGHNPGVIVTGTVRGGVRSRAAGPAPAASAAPGGEAQGRGVVAGDNPGAIVTGLVHGDVDSASRAPAPAAPPPWLHWLQLAGTVSSLLGLGLTLAGLLV
jgi:hypothetical protein